ncbi:kinesin-like protein KIF16B isoform X2 [Stylophora pistillata]|uniref:kinesin-like protein KIF16B isoform X2 n=1 Tax=Stylophora pistillata TaxID=50429 RepID=UPI000C046685|nr:kinesin-like protein KIF16B isoform X2 [Stylophora pistillata]
MASVKVAVRVRPLNQREKGMGAQSIIEMEGKKTTIMNIKANSLPGEGERRNRVKDFSFDFSYWSVSERSRHYASQERVFKDLGTDVLKAAFEGYNACIFAYGQTGSGKTYSMMGSPDNQGLIPRICEGLFSGMRNNADNGPSYRTEVSFLEIYNERVRDLLRPPMKGRPVHSLKVREHPKEGPYVQDLTRHLVSDYAAIENLMEQGNTHRVTASTGMNDTSSRSHAIFTINFTQAKFDHDMPCETVSKINLVDLAGSERADATGLTGERLKEGANINKSLVTLGTVISALADASTGSHSSSHHHHKFIPYRDSVLTWLLKDSLGGNSKTIMIATMSPADVNYAETLSTLRYANRAKNIINKPTINEDANVKLIRDLRAEIDRLKNMISPEMLGEAELAAAKKLSENEARVTELTDRWKDRWRETQRILEEREMKLQQEGVGIKMDSVLPHLVLVDDDLLSTGIVVYHLKEGFTTAGLADNPKKQDIVISGPDSQENHCVFEHSKGHVILNPLDSKCDVNGSPISKPTRLFQGDVILLGTTNVFRFNHPREAAELREKRKEERGSSLVGASSLAWSTKFRSETDLVFKRGTDEESLSRQLEEAKNELEKQKQLEALKIEEARADFASQIQEESKRLNETRAELERQRKLHAMEVQSVEEARSKVQELSQKHEQAELERKATEAELSKEIVTREQDLKMQREQVDKLRDDIENLNRKSEKELSELKKQIRQQKEEELVRLNENMKKIMDLEEERDITKLQAMKEREKLQERWRAESENVQLEREELKQKQRDYEKKFSLLEESKREAMLEKEEFEIEKSRALEEIRRQEKKLEELRTEREKALDVANNDIRKRREVLELEFFEEKGELEEERNNVEERIQGYEALVDMTADNLAEKQNALETRTREENAKIEEAKQKLRDMEEKLNETIKTAEDDFVRKRLDYQDKVDEQREEIKRTRENLNLKVKEINELTQKLEKCAGEEKSQIQREIERTSGIVEIEKTRLASLEEDELKTAETFEKDMEADLIVLDEKKQKESEAIELERLNLDSLEDIKRQKLETEEMEFNQAQEQYNQAKMLLIETKRSFSDLEKRQGNFSTKAEDGLLRLSKVLDGELASQGKQDYMYLLREHRISLKEMDVEGKMKVSEKQEMLTAESEKLFNMKKNLSFVLEDTEKAQEKAEAEWRELQSRFAHDREEEKTTREAMEESLRDIEEEATLSKNLTQREIGSPTTVSLLLAHEKQRIKVEMENKLRAVEERKSREVEELRLEKQDILSKLDKEKEDLERQKEELETLIHKEKVELDKERKLLEREKLEEIEGIIRDKEMEIEELKEKAQHEIDELRERLDETEREVVLLQEKLSTYNSFMVSNGHEEDELADGEVMNYMCRDEEGELYGSNLSLTDSVTPPVITPPPTAVNRFLASVSSSKRNQIQVCIPRYILRGLGRDSYHVFESTVGGDSWSVYRRYRKFRELHKSMRKYYHEVGGLDFPNRRFFGNRAEEFVRARRAQLETYLQSFIGLCSKIEDCPISAMSGRPLTKRDLCDFAPFFKQGIFEQTKNYSG